MNEVALARIESGYPVLSQAGPALLEALRENLQGQKLDRTMLDRITVPTGGAPFFTVPSIDEQGGAPAKEIEGVVVHQQIIRNYWKDKVATGSPPDCYSDDGENGFGDPGGECASCALAQFGSMDGGGRAQACKQKRLLFMLRPSQAIPTVVVVPPSSLKEAGKFLLRLGSAGRPYWSVVAKITLEPAKSRDGKDYSAMRFGVVGQLDESALERVRAYRESIVHLIQQAARSEAAGEAAA